MKTTLLKLKIWMENQLASYKENPEFSDWDRGYKSALIKIKELIEQDGRYKKKDIIKRLK